jgi:4'-phosphopantetheinyl transferase
MSADAHPLPAQTAEKILWGAPPRERVLGDTDVHSWAFQLDRDSAQMADLACFLAPDETERARRFHFESHRNRYIAGRGLLRVILADYLGLKPSALNFHYGSHGKPSLARDGQPPLVFNLAHCDGLALLAVSRLPSVGIDVERVRLLPDAGELVERFFSAAETQAFRQAPSHTQAECFFRLWTRKEAWLKATGEGIGEALPLVEVLPLDPNRPSRVVFPSRLSPFSSWSVQDLHPAPGFAGALAVPSTAATFSFWSWV